MGAREPRLSKPHDKVNRNRVTQYQGELGQRRYIRPRRGFVAVRLFSLGERADLSVRASERQRRRNGHKGGWVHRSETHARLDTAFHRMYAARRIHISSRSRRDSVAWIPSRRDKEIPARARARFLPEDERTPVPFTLASANENARLLHKILCPTFVGHSADEYIWMRQRLRSPWKATIYLWHTELRC